jgi:phosphoribosylpyrophosphate synthetase
MQQRGRLHSELLPSYHTWVTHGLNIQVISNLINSRDKKDKGRAPITAKLLSAMVQRAGVNRIISVDLHTNITKGNFNQ